MKNKYEEGIQNKKKKEMIGKRNKENEITKARRFEDDDDKLNQTF